VNRARRVCRKWPGTSQISELWLMPVLEAMLEQFLLVIRGFHSDNGNEFTTTTSRICWTIC
jgi:hypothetical protein